MRADDEAGEDVAQHHRLFEAVEKDGHQARDQHDHGEILDEGNGMHGDRLLFCYARYSGPARGLLAWFLRNRVGNREVEARKVRRLSLRPGPPDRRNKPKHLPAPQERTSLAPAGSATPRLNRCCGLERSPAPAG
ncbi:hypothetical protein D3C84_436970 [compost metagenome]